MGSSTLSAVLASAGDREHWWVVAPFFWALWLAVLVAVVWFASRRWRRGPDGRDRAKAILAERFARGEISGEEFRSRLEQLG